MQNLKENKKVFKVKIILIDFDFNELVSALYFPVIDIFFVFKYHFNNFTLQQTQEEVDERDFQPKCFPEVNALEIEIYFNLAVS